MTTRASSKVWLWCLQAGGTLGVGWFSIRQVDLAAVWQGVQTVSLPLLAASFTLTVARLPISAWRWRLLLSAHGHNVGTYDLTRILLTSQFFATLLPGASGVDLTRSYFLHRHGVAPRQVVATVVADRAAGIVSLILLSVPPALWVAWSEPALWHVPVTVGGVTIATLAAVHFVSRARGQIVAGPGLARRLRNALTHFHRDMAALVADRPLVARTLVLSVVFQVLGVLTVLLSGLAVGVEMTVYYYFLFVPLIWLWTTLPISISGMGVREGTFLFYFGLAGVQAEAALSLSLLVFAQTLAVGALGGVLLLGTPRVTPG